VGYRLSIERQNRGAEIIEIIEIEGKENGDSVFSPQSTKGSWRVSPTGPEPRPKEFWCIWAWEKNAMCRNLVLWWHFKPCKYTPQRTKYCHCDNKNCQYGTTVYRFPTSLCASTRTGHYQHL